jgi:hypothetical protein
MQKRIVIPRSGAKYDSRSNSKLPSRKLSPALLTDADPPRLQDLLTFEWQPNVRMGYTV